MELELELLPELDDEGGLAEEDEEDGLAAEEEEEGLAADKEEEGLEGSDGIGWYGYRVDEVVRECESERKVEMVR